MNFITNDDSSESVFENHGLFEKCHSTNVWKELILMIEEKLKDNDYDKIEKVLGTIELLNNMIKTEFLSGLIDSCHNVVEKRARVYYDDLYNEIFSSKTLDELEKIKFDDFKTMGQKISKVTILNSLFKDIQDLKHNRELYIKKKDKLSIKERKEIEDKMVLELSSY